MPTRILQQASEQWVKNVFFYIFIFGVLAAARLASCYTSSSGWRLPDFFRGRQPAARLFRSGAVAQEFSIPSNKTD